MLYAARTALSLLTLYLGLSNSEHPEPIVVKVLNQLRKAIAEDRVEQIKHNSDLYPGKLGDLYLWKFLKMPLVSARILQEAKSYHVIMDRAEEARQRAAPLRKQCRAMDAALHDNRPASWEKVYNEFVGLFEDFAKSQSGPSISASVSVGLPWRVTATCGVSSPFRRAKRHLTFLRDLYMGALVPITLRSDIIRLFGDDGGLIREWKQQVS